MRYYGVRCVGCSENIPLTVHKPLEGREVTFNFVPLEPITCPHCDKSHAYDPKDGLYFDGPDDLPFGFNQA
jgi:hypothetical protein